jgi:hypothetical protein
VRVSLFLADFAQAEQTGKVNALGLGWTTCPTPLPALSLVIFLDIDWDETNKPYKLMCDLLTEDGQPAMIPGPFGPQPIHFEAQAEAGRPPGTIHGTAARLALAINIGGGTPLAPGRYEWRVSVEGFEDATAAESFLVHATPGGQVQARGAQG